jgi:putative holliday junction resolvase
MRLMGIDYGSKRVGIALSDDTGTIGSPYRVIKNDMMIIPNLVDIIHERGVGALVIGDSRDNAGKDNPIMRDIRTFADRLHEETQLPVHFELEFFSSAEARRGPGKEVRPLKHGEQVDAQAATVILNSFITRTYG